MSIKYLLLAFCFSLSLIQCTQDSAISEDDVVMDWDTGECFYKESNKPVDGIVNFTYTAENNESWIGYQRFFKKGKVHGRAFNYYSDGTIWQEKYFKNCKLDSIYIVFNENSQIKEKANFKDGLLEGERLFYYSNGLLAQKLNYKNGLLDSTQFEYNEEGSLIHESNFKAGKRDGEKKYFNAEKLQTKLEIYENGLLIKEYEYDSKGKRILPLVEKLDIVKIKTGFYEYRDLNSYQVLYQPMVLIKFKNNSSETFSKSIKIKASFYSGEDEWSNVSDYLYSSYSDTPWEPKMNKQATLQSSVGYKSCAGIGTGTIKCRIYVENELLKTITIKNRLLNSNIL